MNLPSPPVTYSADDQRRLRSDLNDADRQNRKKRQDIEVSSERIILASPSGLRFALTVSDAGLLGAMAL